MSGFVFGIIPLLFTLIIGGLSLYCMLLFILLAHRAIKALNIHLDEKKKTNPYV